VLDAALDPNSLPGEMTLKLKAAGSLTVGNFNGWVKLTSGSFYYPARAYNADVEASYIVYRTGKIDNRYMDILYASTGFEANTLTIAITRVTPGSTITIANVPNGSAA
jgi:hypothetical protein